LQFNGLAMSDFETTDEAFKTAEDLIVDNKAEYGHTGEPRLHKNPLICKYFYVKSEGKNAPGSKPSTRSSAAVQTRRPRNSCKRRGLSSKAWG
jgi:hypothetical protein